MASVNEAFLQVLKKYSAEVSFKEGYYEYKFIFCYPENPVIFQLHEYSCPNGRLYCMLKVKNLTRKNRNVLEDAFTESVRQQIKKNEC